MLAAAYIWTSDLERAHRLAPAIESASTWVNSHNSLDLVAGAWISGTRPGEPRADAGLDSIDFYTKSRTVLVATDGTPVPQFGV